MLIVFDHVCSALEDETSEDLIRVDADPFSWTITQSMGDYALRSVRTSMGSGFEYV